MGLILVASRSVGVLALATLALSAPLPASADEIDDCETLGVETLKSQSGAALEHPFVIDREKIYFDKAETMVGKEFVSSVLHGPANMDTGGEMESVRFLCLHGGTNVGALFIWFLPD